MEYCITVNPIPHSQYRTKFDYEWSIEYQLMHNPLVSVNIRSASLLIFKILYYGMQFAYFSDASDYFSILKYISSYVNPGTAFICRCPSLVIVKYYFYVFCRFHFEFMAGSETHFSTICTTISLCCTHSGLFRT